MGWGGGGVGNGGRASKKKKPDEAVLGARPEIFCEIHQKCVTFWLITRCTGYLLFEDLVTITWPTCNFIHFSLSNKEVIIKYEISLALI